MVLEGDKGVNGRGGIDMSVPGIKAPEFSWLSGIIEIIKVVVTLVTIISIIITLIQVSLYMYRRYKKKKADEDMALEDMGGTKAILDSTKKKNTPKKEAKKDKSNGQV
jgi:cbb3-type cytochrome oxidase subunit 3